MKEKILGTDAANGSDIDMSATKLLRVFVDPVDAKQARWVEIGRQLAALRKEREVLRFELQQGTCEVCGIAFRRARATKRVCSQKCALAKSMRARQSTVYDVDLLREMLPMLVVSGQFKPRVLDIIRMVVIEGAARTQTGDYFQLSHQRVSQVLGRATGVARLMKQMKELIRAEVVAAQAGNGNQASTHEIGSVPIEAQKS